jgi:hypothetical protein
VNEFDLPHEQRHKHSPQTAIAIEEGMKRLEFGVENGQLNQPVRRFAVGILFPLAHRIGQLLGRDGDIFPFLDLAGPIQLGTRRDSPGALL